MFTLRPFPFTLGALLSSPALDVRLPTALQVLQVPHRPSWRRVRQREPSEHVSPVAPTGLPLSPGRGGARAGAVDDLKLGTQSQKLQLHLQLSLGMRVVLCLVYILVQHGGERSDIIERRIL